MISFHVEIPEAPGLALAIAAPVIIFAICETCVAAVGIVRDLVRRSLDLPLEPRQ